MNSGRIKWVSPDMSYGFILLPDGQEAYFNSYDFQGGDRMSLTDKVGEEVSFELLRTERGYEAFNIQTFAFA